MSPDVSIKSDLLVSVMNLIEQESHAMFSYWITNDEKWLEIKGKVSEIRKRQMLELEKEEDSQLHCFNKHTMSAMFRSWECGDKHWRNGEKDLAIKYYQEAKELLEIFYKLNFEGSEENVEKQPFYKKVFK